MALYLDASVWTFALLTAGFLGAASPGSLLRSAGEDLDQSLSHFR